MAGNSTVSESILLLDNYSLDSQNLCMSFQRAGDKSPVVVINEEGFLPEGILSVYGFFLGDFKGVLNGAGPKYFNEIVVPDYWEISGTNSMGNIHDLYRERGKIFYAEPKHKRLVKIVDWYDNRGVVRFSDHYNRYGAIYARTAFNAKGQRFNKSYFSAEGHETIVENYITGDIILNDGKEIHFFRTKTDFVLYFLKKAGLPQDRIFFNSLSTPFFVSEKLKAPKKRDVLFWQEPIGDEIPGNMQVILKGQASRTTSIIVQKRSVYEKLLALGAQPDMVRKLGFCYSFERNNTHRSETLICTNSDRIEHCREIIEALPNMRFHIAALTEMSSKLMEMGKYLNVSLYPNVKMTLLDELFVKCDYYLDINYETEIVSAVRRAFMQNQLIFAFEETVHNRDFVAEEHLYRAEEAGEMTRMIEEIMEDKEKMEQHLLFQHEMAMEETEESYLQI